MGVGAEVAAAVAAIGIVDLESSWIPWCCDWGLVAYLERQDFGGTLNDMKRTRKQEIREKHHGKPLQLG